MCWVLLKGLYFTQRFMLFFVYFVYICFVCFLYDLKNVVTDFREGRGGGIETWATGEPRLGCPRRPPKEGSPVPSRYRADGAGDGSLYPVICLARSAVDFIEKKGLFVLTSPGATVAVCRVIIYTSPCN